MRIAWTLCILLLVPPATRACADGGLVRLDEEVGAYHVVALTAPTPLIEGELDLTVLVAYASDRRRAATDVGVEVAIVPVGQVPREDVWLSLASSQAEHQGGLGAFFQVAPGSWTVNLRLVDAQGVVVTTFPIQVAQRTRWDAVWPWLLPLPLVMGIWLLREWARADDAP